MWAKTVLIAAITGGTCFADTAEPTLRMKCTRHRCHDAPVNCWATAAFNPACASEITRCTPDEPACPSPVRNSRQKSKRPTVSDRGTEHLAGALDRHPGRDDKRVGDHMRPDPDLAVRRIQEDVRERGVGQAAFPEPGDLGYPARRRSARPATWRPPSSTPSAATRSSTLRVDTPWT